MDLIKRYARDFLHYFSSHDSSRSKKRRIESRATLGQAIRCSNFYLLAFLKPQSVIELLTVNKELNALLSDDVINQYGKRIKQFIGPSLQANDLTYRDFFVQQLQQSPKTASHYAFQGTMNVLVDDGKGDLDNHTVVFDERNALIPK